VQGPSDVTRADDILQLYAGSPHLQFVFHHLLDLPYDTLVQIFIMPPAKKQKTSDETSAPTQEQEPESATPHKNDEKPKLRDVRPMYLDDIDCNRIADH
jgi:hypothetical protein